MFKFEPCYDGDQAVSDNWKLHAYQDNTFLLCKTDDPSKTALLSKAVLRKEDMFIQRNKNNYPLNIIKPPYMGELLIISENGW